MGLTSERKYSRVESGTQIVESRSSMILVIIDDHFGLESLHHQSCAARVSLVGISISYQYGVPDEVYMCEGSAIIHTIMYMCEGLANTHDWKPEHMSAGLKYTYAG